MSDFVEGVDLKIVFEGGGVFGGESRRCLCGFVDFHFDDGIFADEVVV